MNTLVATRDAGPEAEVVLEPTDLPVVPARSGRVASFFAAAVLAVPLVAHAWVGTTSRYMWDDYCFANALHRHGFLGSLAWWYGGWSGRIGHWLSMNVAELAGPRSAQFVPALAIVAWVAALAWAIRGIARSRNRRPGIAASIAFAEMAVAATLLVLPLVFQSLYWRVGALEYVTPFVILALVAGWIGRIAHGAVTATRWRVACIGALALVAGTFSETQVAIQTAVAAMFALATLRGGEVLRKARIPAVAVFAGSVVAAIVVIAAPGNAVRRAYYPLPPDAWKLAGMSFDFTLRFMRDAFVRSPVVMALAFAAPFMATYLTAGRNRPGAGDRWRLALAPAFVFGAALVAVMPSAQGQSGYPVPRALITPLFVLVCGLALCGSAAGAILGRRRSGASSGVPAAVFAGLVLALAAAGTTHALTPLDTARSYAAHVDARAHAIEAVSASGAGIVVNILPPGDRAWVGWGEIGPDPQYGANVCMAEYYGLSSIRAV